MSVLCAVAHSAHCAILIGTRGESTPRIQPVSSSLKPTKPKTKRAYVHKGFITAVPRRKPFYCRPSSSRNVAVSSAIYGGRLSICEGKVHATPSMSGEPLDCSSAFATRALNDRTLVCLTASIHAIQFFWDKQWNRQTPKLTCTSKLFLGKHNTGTEAGRLDDETPSPDCNVLHNCQRGEREREEQITLRSWGNLMSWHSPEWATTIVQESRVKLV